MCLNIVINRYIKESVKQDLTFSSLRLSTVSLTGLTFLPSCKEAIFSRAMADQVGPLFFPAFELLLMTSVPTEQGAESVIPSLCF